jgi:hypothetical protein
MCETLGSFPSTAKKKEICIFANKLANMDIGKREQFG